ncbi:astacin-like metalloendopeptidase [Anolis carolinensis]|uniref:astacin-like metalloendopeptidase n=1 Tax=Anolis carolinensis TaxID=28377 RepID=UPI002F2B549F
MAIWCIFTGLLGLLSISSAQGRGDTFHAMTSDEDKLEDDADPPDDILDINLDLIPPEAPESSFLIEGDIIKKSPFRLFSSADPRWPKKRGIVQIPYVISYRYDRSSLKIIEEAFEEFARFTCVRFVPRSYQRDFISIAPLSGCFSSVGRVGGMQAVSLAPVCLRKGRGVALHELMHLLGFWHEHSRADRDNYIRISWNDVLTGFETNFLKSWNTNMLGDYDYSSVMHYGRTAFSMTGLPTIIPLSRHDDVFLGQRWNLSRSDIARVNKLYRCSQAAAQAETSTWRAFKKKMMDFVPRETQPCANESQVETSTAWNHCIKASDGVTMSSSRTVDEGITSPEAQTRTGWPSGAEEPKERMESSETSSQAEEGRGFLGPTAETPCKNLSKEMEAPNVVSTSQKTSLQNPTSSTKELRRSSPSDKEIYLPEEQRPALEEEGSPRPTEIYGFSVVINQPNEAFYQTTSISASERSPPPPKTNPKELRRSSPSDKEIYLPEEQRPTLEEEGSPRPTEIYGFSVAINQPNDVFYQTISISGSERSPPPPKTNPKELRRSSPSDKEIYLPEEQRPTLEEEGSPRPTEIYGFSVVINQPNETFYQTISISGSERSPPLLKTKAATASYRLLSPKNSTSSVLRFGEEETMGPEAGSPGSSDTVPGNVGKEVEGLQNKEHSTTMHVPSNPNGKDYGENKLEHDAFPSQEDLLPGSVEVPNAHLGWTGSGSPSRSWSGVTKQPKERTVSKSQPREREPFSYPPAHQRRKEQKKWEMFSRKTSPESFTGIGSEEHTPTQIDVWEMGSLAMENPWATGPAEMPDLPGTVGHRTRALWSQQGPTKGYASSVLAMEQASSMAVQEKWEPDFQTASIMSTERQTMGQKVGGELGTGSPVETKTHGRATLWRLFSLEPFSSQMPIQPGKQPVGTQRQPLSIETAIPGGGKAQVQTRNPNTVALKLLCGAKVFGALSPTKPSTRRVSPDMGHKLGVTGGEHPGLETKERGSTLKGRSPSTGGISTPLSWVSQSNIDGNGTGNYVDFGKEETSSTVPHKGTLQKMPPTMNVHVPRVSSILVHSKRPQSSSISWRTATDTEGPSPQSLEEATKSQVASHPHEMISAELVKATEEMVLHKMNWVGTFAQEARNGQSGTWSLTLGVATPALSSISIAEETQLLSTSVEPPKPKNFGETSIGSHPTKESLSSEGKVLVPSTEMVFVTRLPNATHLETWKSLTMASVGIKRWREMATEEADDSRATLTASDMMSSAEASRQGSHEERIAVDTSPQLHQNGMAPWSTSGQVASHHHEMISAEPVKATEETVLHKLKWVGTFAQEARNGQSGAWSPTLGVRTPALPPVSIASRAILTASNMMSSAEASRQGSREEHIAVETSPQLHQSGMALWSTSGQVASHPHEMISAEPVNATEEMVLHKMNGVSTFAQEARNGQSDAWSPTLGVATTALPPVSIVEETQLLGTSVKPPKPKNFGETSIGSHPTKENLSSAGKALALGIVMVSVTRKRPQISSISWRTATDTEKPSPRSLEATPALPPVSIASRATLTASDMMSSAEASREGSHEEHIAVETSPQLHQSWSTSGPKITKGLREEKGKDHVQKSGVSISEDTTIAGATNIGNRPPSPLTYPSSVGDEEEPSTIHGETRSMPSSSGTYSHLGASMSSHPEAKYFLHAENNLGAETMETTVPFKESSEVSGSTSKVDASPGISDIYSQTLGPADYTRSEFSMVDITQSQEAHDLKEFPLTEGRRVQNFSAESFDQTAETRFAVKPNKMLRNDLKQIMDLDNHVAKRSLLRTMGSNPGHNTPRKLKLKAIFPKKRVLRKLVAAPTRITHHSFAPRRFKAHLRAKKDGIFLQKT